MSKLLTKHKLIFSEILNRLKKEIGDTNYALSFSSVELVSLENEILIFGVPADFFKETIEKNHLEKIKEIAINSNITEVIVIVSDQKNAADFFSQEEKNDAKEKNSKKSTKTILAKPVTPQHETQEDALNPEFSFTNFVVGSSNSFAHSVATVIAKNPGEAHNPCLIYGNVGLGKTHLLQAIGNYIRHNFTDRKVLFYPSEKFLNAFTFAIANKKSRDFKNKIRNADVLLLDDIQFFSNKPSLQEEFYHSFNTLLLEKKQMVFASDRPIHQIRDLEERLQSRFRSNMIVDLQPPEPEMALGILHNALNKNSITDIDTEVINYIVERLRYNIRDMLGFVSRIVGYQSLTGNIVDLITIKQWAMDYSPKKNNQRRNTVDKILSVIANYYDIAVTELKSKKRNRRISHVRHIAIYLIKELTRCSQTDVGDIFNVTHVSVSKAIVQIDKERDIDPHFADEIEEIKERIYQKGD